ncbi:AAA family ATPase [Roseibium aggregatum]|uniref:AAA family ATPase n=1 Tax=Roseibium aggregatum TaxID=187304 RepID=UPI00094B0177|nr:AAA family ATPase [Roseibium aggregatum]UFI03707.1 AAA family ATPase [Roseibium aggregatum]
MQKVELDVSRGELLRDGEVVRLRPKTLAVLVELHAREGEVVSQQELRHLIWGQQHGRETGPKQCIRELRRLLGDSAETPGFIETVGRQGYRLVGEITVLNSGTETTGTAPLCVGRTTELQSLADCAAAVRAGKRIVSLVAGEAGSGKSRLVETFAATLPRTADFWSARGQCIPHPGAREPYGPLIEIVTQLAEGASRKRVLRLLEDVAPSWRDLLPQLRSGREPAPLPTRLTDTHPDSMLRELTALMERLSQQQPGVIILEDLHWADQSTLAWLLSWAQRRAPARTLVVGTYRFDELDKSGDLQTTLHYLQRVQDFSPITLDGLDETAVADLLKRRFPDHRLPASLAGELRRRTEGHAILVDAIIDQWHRDGVLESSENRQAPEQDITEIVSAISRGAGKFIAGEIGRLDPYERQLLDIASVAGIRFSAAMLSDERLEVEKGEAVLDRLASVRRFIQRAGVMAWPDGTQATRYVFRHALYQEALYDAIPAANRQGLHERIGSRLETAFKSRTGEIASTLADHFERAADWKRAAVHRGLAGLTALERGAITDAAAQFRQALVSFAACEPDPEMHTAECRTLLGLGAALIVGDHFTTDELRDVYERAATLAGRTNDPTTIVPALAGLWNHHLTKADLAAADELAKGLDDLAEDAPALYAMVAHNAVGQTRFFRGDLAACLPHINAVCSAYGTNHGAEASVLFGEDPGIVCRQYAACVHQLLGQSEHAERLYAEGMTLTDTLEQPFGRAQMLWAGALIAREREDPVRVLERATALIETCEAAAIPFWRPYGDLLAGWAQVVLGNASGLQQIHEGLNAQAAMDVTLTRPYGLSLYAEATSRCGSPAEGLKALASAFKIIRRTGERWHEADLHRLWALLSVQTGRTRNASSALRRAIRVARTQNAVTYEKRAQDLLDRIAGQLT